jgi:hypothetical protein
MHTLYQSTHTLNLTAKNKVCKAFRKLKKIGFLLLLLSMSCTLLFAQKEWSNWFNSGKNLLTFKNGYPEIVSNFISPVPDNTDFFHFYNWGNGGISYSDPVSGEFQFIISNGIGYSKDFHDFPNPYFIGNLTNTSSYRIIPFPNDAKKFYVVHFMNNPNAVYQPPSQLQVRPKYPLDLSYSIVDLNLNNGLGDFSTINNVIAPFVTPQITTVRHANGNDVWVIFHSAGTDNLSSILFTGNGIQPPINSKTGANKCYNYEYGMMTASHDGKLIAGVAISNGCSNSEVQLFDFDKNTGKLSNYRPAPSTSRISKMQFSPDNSKIYILEEFALYQYDLDKPDILASKTKIAGTENGNLSDMQLAPDGKIYISTPEFYEENGTNFYTAAIECPNLPQYACNYNPKAIKNYQASFPNLINDFINQPKAAAITKFSIGNDTTFCADSFIISAPEWWQSYRWNTGDTTRTISITKPGIYYVLTGDKNFSCPSGYGYITIVTRALKMDLGRDTSFCKGVIYPFHVNDDYNNILWENGSHTRDTLITTNASLMINAKDKNGCITGDTVSVFYSPYPYARLGNDTTLCGDNKITLSVENGNEVIIAFSPTPPAYLWKDGSTGKSITVSDSGRYWAEVTYQGCTAYDTISINYIRNDKTILYLKDAILIEGDSLLLKAAVENVHYLWNTGDTTQSIYVKTAGKYTLDVNNGICTFSDTVNVELNTNPSVQITSPVNHQVFEAGRIITINVAANDIVGHVSKVDFYNKGIKIGEDSTTPYTYTSLPVEAGDYTITAKATDNSGTVSTSDSVTIIAMACKSDGGINAEGFTNIPGSEIANLTSSPAFFSSASVSAQLEKFEYGISLGDNYGARVRGYICAPLTGLYTFYIAGDDQVGLWLSTNDNPANKVLIAYAESFTKFRQWDKFPAQKSVPVYLVKGGRYYIETLHKESAGSDHLSVAWRLPNGIFEAPVDASRLSPFYALPVNGRIAADFSQVMRENKISVGSEGLTASVMPNPSQNYFYISTKSTSSRPLSIHIIDVTGRIIEQKINIAANGSFRIGNLFPPGVYFVEILQGTRKERLKLIKQQ